MPRPDFTGLWLNTEIGGDTPRFFAEGLEVSFIQRKLAAVVGYGKGELTHKIVSEDDGAKLTCTLNMPEKVTSVWICDGEVHETNQAKYTAVWEGEKLIVTPVDGPPTAFRLTRYMVDSNMVTELDYPNKPGVTMKRTFVKQ